MDTPPEVMTKSAASTAADSVRRKSAGSSVLCATDTGSTPVAASSAAKVMPLEL